MFGRRERLDEMVIGPGTRAIRLRLRIPYNATWTEGGSNQLVIGDPPGSVLMLLGKPGPGRPRGSGHHDIVIPVHVEGEGRTLLTINPVMHYREADGADRLCACIIELPLATGFGAPVELLVEHSARPL